MIKYTYSKTEPTIRRLQGGILVPVEKEQVTLETEEGSEKFWRFKLLKFKDEGQDISDESAFMDKYQEKINDYLKNDVDLQRISQRHPQWDSRRPLRGPGIPADAMEKVSDAPGMGTVARLDK